MQEIFYNGKIISNNENQDIVDAMIVNEGSIFFAGSNDEVLNLKTDDTKENDLKEYYVYPTLFDIQTSVFEQIDRKVKSAKKIQKIQFSDDIDENYENFENFEAYKTEYFKLEKQYIKNGITTICEKNIDKLAFAFWKKMADEKLLNIDVVGYVDLVGSKQVMDDNCVTYRKYRNHFRLGGYNIKIDGKVQELKAWLSKPYSGTKSHYGAGEFYGEHLYYILKTALEERKQILFETYGDKALCEVLTVLSEIEKKDKITDFYRPLFYGVNVLSKTLVSQIKHFDGTVIFEEYSKDETKQIKKFLGFLRVRKYHNYQFLRKQNLRFMVLNKQFQFQNFSAVLSLWLSNNRILNKIKTNSMVKDNFNRFINQLIYHNPAYICFDQDTKATLETQRKADFMIVTKEIFESIKEVEKNIKSVYVRGQKKY